MTRILVQRGSAGGSSSNPSRNSSLPGSSSARAEPQVTTPQVLSALKDDEVEEVQEQVVVDELLEFCGSSDSKATKGDDLLMESFHDDNNESSEIKDSEKAGNEEIVGQGELLKGMAGLRISERLMVDTEGSSVNSAVTGSGSSQPPPPPVPPPKLSAGNSNSRRFISGNSSSVWIGSSRRAVPWPVVSTRTSPTGSRPSSPRSHGESEGYNSADEQNPCFVSSSYDDIVSFWFC